MVARLWRMSALASAGLLAVCFSASCERRETRSHVKIYILCRDVKAGEQLSGDLVDEIFCGDGTRQIDMRKDFGWVTDATFSDHLGEYFAKDLERFTPLTTADLTKRVPDGIEE